MANFLALTHFNRYTREECPCLVNLDTVTFITPLHLNLPRKTGPGKKPDGTPDYANYVEEYPVEERDVSIISFAAGMHEETESIYVTESLATIYRSA